MKILNHIKLVVITTRPLRIHLTIYSFWIRVFGYGISVRNARKYPLLFSERNGFVKGVKIGMFYAKLLYRRD